MRSEPRQRVVTGTDQTAGRSWHSCIWGELATLEYGKALRGYRSAEGQYPVFGTNGPIGWHTDMLDAGPSVIVGRKGTLGVQYTPGPFFVIDTAFYLKQRVQFDVRWAYYELLSHDINGLDSGSSIPSTTREAFYSLPVRVPPLAEQRTIAHILGTLDAKIEVNRRMNATLDDIARALFTSWFVHFDPVRAKAALTQRASPGGSAWLVARAYLDRLEPALAALFPDRFVDSALGPIPAGWELSTIGQETQAVGGGTPSTKEPAYWHDARHYWATPKDLAKLTSPVLLNTARKISDAGLEKISSGLLPVGTVLLSSRAPIGYLAMTEVPTAINQGFIALICPGRLSHWYVLHWCAEHLEAIKAIAGGSTFAEISKQTFRPLPVLIPPRPLLLAFDTAVRPLYRRTVVNMQESAVLAALRDTLLPKLLSGQIRVRDAAAQTSDLQEKGEQGQGR